MSRSGGAGILAVCVLAVAWVLGSTALAILGFGIGLAALASRAWARFVSNGLTIERRPIEGPPVEGDALLLEAELAGRSWLASRVEWRERVGALGEHAAVVAPDGRACLELPRMPRGRYRLGPGRLLATDPLGLTRVEVPVERESTLTVRPRVPELETLFTETGAWGEGGRRALVRRPSGLEPHGVREYQEGEPLRAVHWPTSARRGELMVRELEDAPRDSIAVVLDVEASAVAGVRATRASTTPCGPQRGSSAPMPFARVAPCWSSGLRSRESTPCGALAATGTRRSTLSQRSSLQPQRRCTTSSPRAGRSAPSPSSSS